MVLLIEESHHYQPIDIHSSDEDEPKFARLRYDNREYLAISIVGWLYTHCFSSYGTINWNSSRQTRVEKNRPHTFKEIISEMMSETFFLST